MKLTIYKNNDSCEEIGQFKISHVVMFDNPNELSIETNLIEDTMKLINCLIVAYVPFKVQGTNITLLLNEPSLRVRFRFDK